MAFTTGNDVNILQASDATTVTAREGDDRYIISGDLIADNQTISITDTLGANTIQLVGGLSIASSSVAADAAQLTLSNGAVITLLGASTFTYQIGGDSLTGTGGASQTYTEFVTTSLGLDSVPAAGEAPVDGTAVDVNEDGTTTGGSSSAYTLTAAADSVDEGSTATFNLTSVDVAEGTEVAYTISGVDAADVDGGSLTGTATIAADGTATISVALLADAATEGAETLTVTLDGTSVSDAVTVNDTSTDAASFTLTPSADSVDEGASVTVDITSTGSAAGDTVDYVITGIDEADLASGSLTGTVTLDANLSASVSIALASDLTTEGAETITFTVDGVSTDITVNDTSTQATFALTTETDHLSPDAEGATANTTAGNDVISGVTSSLSSERTLDTNDIIDGGDGSDELNVTMNTGFSGFSDGNGITSVETLNLTNASVIARSYDMTNTTGVETINIDATNAPVNLTDLEASDLTVNFANQDSGSTSVSFVSGNDILTDTTDEMSIGLDNMGTEDDADTTADEESVVTATINDIEVLNVTATGANVVSLDSNDLTNLVVDGAGSLKVGTVGTGLETIDASASTGNLDIDTDATTDTLTSLKTGSGDDRLTVTVTDTQANAVVEGGEGNDTLELLGTGTVQYSQTGFETIELGALGGALTYSGTNVSGITDITITSDVNNTASFVNMGSGDISVLLEEDNDGNNSELEVDNSGVLTVSTVASSTATDDKTTETNDTDITAANAGAFVLNMGAYTEIEGNITVASATSFVVTMESGQDSSGNELTEIENSTITANSTTSFEVDASNGLLDTVVFDSTSATSGSFTTGEVASDIEINAANLTDLTLTAAGDLTLNAGTTTGLEVLTADTQGTLTVTDNLEAVASVNLSGTGTDAEVDLANLGSATHDYNLSVTASGLDGNLDIGTIDTDTGAVITLDVDEVTGTVTVGAIGSGGDQGANTVISAMGTGDAVSFGTIAQDFDVTINADVSGAFETGDITAGDDVVINLNDTTGLAKIDAINAENITISGADTLLGMTDAAGTAAGDTALDLTADASVSFTGSSIQNNAVDITLDDAGNGGEASVTVTLNGGIGNDDFSIVDGNAVTSLTVSGTGAGLGTDDLDITLDTAATDYTVDASGVISNLNTDIVTVDGNDTITMAAAGGSVDATTGYDTVTMGSGQDTYIFDEGDSVAASGQSLSTNLAANDTLTFANGIDIINNFNAGASGDIIKGVNAAEVPTTGINVAVSNGFTGDTFFISGNWNSSTNTFTVKADGEGDDTIIVDAENGAAALNLLDDMILLVGVDSDNLHADNFAV